jgi:hypothetical protein
MIMLFICGQNLFTYLKNINKIAQFRIVILIIIL